MTVKALETMFERLTLLEAATTPAELCVALLEATKRFGVTSVLGGIIPDVASSHTTHANGVILADWPSQWANRYFSKGYLPRDPTILRVKISQQAFMWRELGEEGILAKSSNRVMHEAADFGLVAGFTIPILSVGGAKAAISFAGSVMELSLEDQTYVKLLGMVAIVKATNMGKALTPVRVALTQRQKDVLNWIAEGKTDWDIASILGVSRHSVDKYVRQAFERLGATSRAHAVAKAIRLGVLR